MYPDLVAAPGGQSLDELIAFLPAFAKPSREFVHWSGAEVRPDGSLSAPYPSYALDVSEFFDLAAKPFWEDLDAAGKPAADWLADAAFVASASLDQVRTMLTHLVRGERFCDGCWALALERGQVQALLRRLVVIRAAR